MTGAAASSGAGAAGTGLIVCADDYALHPLVDQAVQQLARAGRLSATSCMTTAPRWREAAAGLQGLRPALSLGLHFNLTEGHGVPGSAQGTGARPLEQVLRAAYLQPLPRQRLQGAWREQLDAFEQALGTPPDFIDGHQHVHQLPGVREALLDELHRRYGAHERPWVRSTAPAGQLWRSPKASVIALLGGWSASRLLRRAGVAMNAGFGGVYGFDAPKVEIYRTHVRRWLAQLRPGSLLMCHPATAPVPGDAIGAQRAVEFGYLASPDFDRDLRQAGLHVHQGPVLQRASR